MKTETIIRIPQTYGIKYAGSKLKIIPYVISLINELKDVRTVLDGFSGTTRVSQALAQLGYHTTSSDISVWSDVVAHCFLKSSKKRCFLSGIYRSLKWFKRL